MENTKQLVKLEENQKIDFSDFEEMEEIITPGILGFFGCCTDVTW